MTDIPEMTVAYHHESCIGVMAACYRHVPPKLKRAIREGCEAAKKMGMNIKPENLGTDQPLHADIRMLSE